MQPDSDFFDSEDFKKAVRTLQIVVGALCLGVINFLLIAIFVVPAPAAPPSGAPIFTYVGLAFTAAEILGRVIVRHFILASALKSIVRGDWIPGRKTVASILFPMPQPDSLASSMHDAGKLCSVFRTRTIISAAMHEGPAFFKIICYIMERRIEAIAVAAALLAGVAMHVPTATGLRHWVTERLQIIEQMRRDGTSVNA